MAKDKSKTNKQSLRSSSLEDLGTAGLKQSFSTNKQQELESQLKRTMADYQNLERRIEEERKLLGQLSSALVIEKFLPVLDNLEAAQSHLKDEGLELVIKQFKEVLSSEGVEEIVAEGSQFDPKLHEAVEAKEGERDNQVIKVITRGYQMNGNVLRAAKVVVERKKVEEKKDDYEKEVSQYSSSE